MFPKILWPQTLSSPTIATSTPSRIYLEVIPGVPLPKPKPTLYQLVNDARLWEIAYCESGRRQFNDDGSVVRGRENPLDVGFLQINEHYWLKKSKQLGYNIYTLEGNIKMAHYIRDVAGYSQWMCNALV